MIRAIELAYFPFFSTGWKQFWLLDVNSPSSIQYGIAVLVRTCSTALLHPTHYDFDRFDSASVEQAIGKPVQVKSKVAPCQCLGPLCFDRRFGGRIVWKVAPGGARDRAGQTRRRSSRLRRTGRSWRETSIVRLKLRELAELDQIRDEQRPRSASKIGEHCSFIPSQTIGP
jgi:hypothetical protein